MRTAPIYQSPSDDPDTPSKSATQRHILDLCCPAQPSNSEKLLSTFLRRFSSVASTTRVKNPLPSARSQVRILEIPKPASLSTELPHFCASRRPFSISRIECVEMRDGDDATSHCDGLVSSPGFHGKLNLGRAGFPKADLFIHSTVRPPWRIARDRTIRIIATKFLKSHGTTTFICGDYSY